MEKQAHIKVEVTHLFISAGHNYVGHYGKPPGEYPIKELDKIQCEAGRGIVDDRYFGHEENFKGQITFFDLDVYERMVNKLGADGKPPSALRRNVLLKGIDLNTFIGQRFTLQGIEFEGTEECRPCFWMDQAVSEGAEEFLRGSGGLRARILTSGPLRKGPCTLTLKETKG